MWSKVTPSVVFIDKEYFVGWHDCFGKFFADKALFNSFLNQFTVTRDDEDFIVYPQFYVEIAEPKNVSLHSARVECINNGAREIYDVYNCESEDDLFEFLFFTVGRVSILSKWDIPTDMLKDTSMREVVKIVAI